MNSEIIKGNWISQNGKIVGDENCQNIEDILKSGLIKVATRDDGWVTLFKDASDNTYLELFYPQSEMQGGGPPALAKLTKEEVKVLYKSLLHD